MSDSINKVQRYRERAEECRRLAEIMKSGETSRHYAELAECYAALAEAEERFAKPSPLIE